MRQEEFVRNYIYGKKGPNKCGSMSRNYDLLYSYAMPIAMRHADRHAVAVLDAPLLPTVTSRAHAGLVRRIANTSETMSYINVPSLPATREHIIEYYQPILAKIERRFMRSHNTGTLHEYIYRYRDMCDALFNTGVPPMPAHLEVIWAMEQAE
jgi:hypothetical protein